MACAARNLASGAASQRGRGAATAPAPAATTATTTAAAVAAARFAVRVANCTWLSAAQHATGSTLELVAATAAVATTKRPKPANSAA